MREAHYNAFPSPDSDGKCNPGECGLTKLEYFAGLAMQGDWAAQDMQSGIFECRGETSQYTLRAQEWVKGAKALLAELEKES